MTSTKDMLSQIQSTLKTALPNLSVELFPENPDQYRLNHPVGAVLVGYGGSDYRNLGSAAHFILQDRDILIAITIIARHLNTTMLDALDDVKGVLNGLILNSETSRMYATSDRFIGHYDGTWRHVINFSFTQQG